MRILSKEAAEAAAKTRRLNLIFQGLVAFWDADPHYYDVLIPDTACTHKAKYGDPLDCPRDCPRDQMTAHLRSFKHNHPYPGPSHYRIEGVPPASASMICKPSPANAIILTGLDVDESKVLIRIRVPKPYIIRHYRGTETHGLPIAGDTGTQGCMHQAPDVVHEVTVFSYFAFHDPHLLGPDDHFKIPKRPRTDGDFWNLCIYAQPESQINCSISDSTALGDMFVIKSTGGHPNVDVSLAIGSDDGPPHRTSNKVGIECLELLALSELDGPNECDCDKDKKVPADKVPADGGTLTAVPGGCSGLFGGA